jgi:hypothetical protein
MSSEGFIGKRPVVSSSPPLTDSLHLTVGIGSSNNIHLQEALCMHMAEIPFGITNWSAVKRTEHKGETGVAYWQTQEFGGIRVRLLEYSPGYLADHWCVKGHILFCIEGELHTELDDGREFVLKPGMSYQDADNAEPHRSSTSVGAKLFVVD